MRNVIVTEEGMKRIMDGKFPYVGETVLDSMTNRYTRKAKFTSFSIKILEIQDDLVTFEILFGLSVETPLMKLDPPITVQIGELAYFIGSLEYETEVSIILPTAIKAE